MQSKHTKEEYEEVLRLHREGLGYRKISKKTGIPRGTVGTWVTGKRKPFDAWSDNEWVEWKAKIFTDETRANMSKAHMGIKHSPETIEKMSKSRMGSLNPMWKGDDVSDDQFRARARTMYPAPEGKQIHHIDGNPRNNEPENIMFATQRGHMEVDGRIERLIERNKKGHSPETKEKLRKSRIGRKHTPESIEKMRKIKLGKKLTPEAKEKIRQKALERWARWKREGRPYRNKALIKETNQE